MLFLMYLFLISHPVFYLLYNENYMKTSVACSLVILRIFFFYPPTGSFTDPSAEGLSRERARERDRSRPHERRHHSSAGEKQRYYSCERYGSREMSHAKSAGPSRSTSPGEGQDTAILKQVSYSLFGFGSFG